MSLSKEKFTLTIVESKNIIASKTLVTALKLVPLLERVIKSPDKAMEYLDDNGNVLFTLTWQDKETAKRIASAEVSEMSSDYLEDREGDLIIFENPPFPQLESLGKMNRVPNPTQAYVAHTLIKKYTETE